MALPSRCSDSNPTATATDATPPPLPCPLPDLRVALSATDLRATAYELLLLVAASRATGGARTLTYTAQPASTSSSSIQHRSGSGTSTAAAGQLKGATGLGPSKGGRPAALELVRRRMGITEQADARIRRGLLRIAAGQIGRDAEFVVLPLEFLQKFKASDFPDPLEYEAWQTRNFKLLEAGLLMHPFVPLKKSGISAQRMRQILREAYNGKLESGRNSEFMQRLRSVVMSLACRTLDDTSVECHWADGFPLNLHIYKMLVEACFDGKNGTVVDEIDEIMELLKKTWVILGINQMLHNIYFTWALFNHFVMLDQANNDLLSATENMLIEVAKDSKITTDPDYCDVLSSALSSILGWTEKRLLAYHDTFNTSNIDSMQYLVSIGISTAEILADDISYENHDAMTKETNFVCSRIANYICTSLRAAFTQKMEEAGSKRSRKSRHLLSILAKEVDDLATNEKNIYSPILKKWHPLAAAVSVGTLHSCFGNELKQFISGLTEITPVTVEVLVMAEKLEKNLFHIMVEDSMDIDDRVNSTVKEMSRYEAGTVMVNLVKAWVREQVGKLKGCVDHNLQQEAWNLNDTDRNCFAPSSAEIMQLIYATMDAFFQLPIPSHSALLPDLSAGLDRCLQHYISKMKTGYGTRSTLFPQLPHLTRCDVRSKLFKKNEKPQFLVKRGSQVQSTTGNQASIILAGLCVRINTLHYIQSELENLDKKMKICLQNAESAQIDTADGASMINFELSRAACQEGMQQLCETTAYTVIFSDLSHVLLDTLYVGTPASNGILPLLKELGPILRTISATVHSRARNRLLMAMMKASFDGFLLVLLAGGPTRAFSCQDYPIIEDDFRALRGLYLAYCDGLPEELVAKASSEVKNILPLLRTDTETLIRRFQEKMSGSYDSTSKSRFPMPPVPTRWSPENPNTILRVLCYRNDEAATKFLKKTYDLPKTL